jgi:N-ethylmaleimide reductase
VSTKFGIGSGILGGAMAKARNGDVLDMETAKDMVTSDSASVLWSPILAGEILLPHRLAMAPMTRARSTPEGVPTVMNAKYYAQRASMALIISEGTQPSPDGQGYPLTPGIFTDRHVLGWRLVTDAVHEAGGRIVIQLMHTGRVSHPLNTPHGRQPVAPSAVKPLGTIFTTDGLVEMPTPRELSTQEMSETVDDYRRAAMAAVVAGADGVEIHAGNGYLIHQFLSRNSNLRTDQYGGSIENRMRFALEVARAVSQEIGAGRTGLVISPGNKFNDIQEGDTSELYNSFVAELAPLGLSYLNVVHGGDEELILNIRRTWPSVLMLNRHGADIDRRILDVEEGLADVVTIGEQALANPDLVERLKSGAILNEVDHSTFYGGDERGYTDYPTLEPGTYTQNRGRVLRPLREQLDFAN